MATFSASDSALMLTLCALQMLVLLLLLNACKPEQAK